MNTSTKMRTELITIPLQFQYRDHRDGLASILEVLYNGSSGLGITHLMFVTQITWASLIPFLEELIEKEMITSKVMPGMKIKSRRNHRVFSITQKGIRFLTLYKELKACLGS